MAEMRGIDISNHQGRDGMNLSKHLNQIDFCICKATQGIDFVDAYCDKFVQTLIGANKPWGFYHFADARNDAASEADYFIRNTENYFGYGIPVLDWEYLYDSDGNIVSNPSVSWVNTFVRQVHDKTGVWPWIYANPWRFNQGGVEENCMRWIASYPSVVSPALDYKLPDVPDTDGFVGAWQFCSDGRLRGYSENLDFNVFYGDATAWAKYAKGDRKDSNTGQTESGSTSVFENEKVKVEVVIKAVREFVSSMVYGLSFPCIVMDWAMKRGIK